MREIHEISADSTNAYASVLEASATALQEHGLAAGRNELEPIRGEVWSGKVALNTAPRLEGKALTARTLSNSLRAEVFFRDNFICTACGLKTVPRNILVAFHDLYPEAIPYHPNYKRGHIHPVFWALAPEADHRVAHSKGGTNTLDNLTTLHALCNTRKSDTIATDEVLVLAKGVAWDGLLGFYPSLLDAGALKARPSYHQAWRRHFGLPPTG